MSLQKNLNAQVTNALMILASLCGIVFIPAPYALSQVKQLPIMHYAGIIPVQWEKTDLWQDLKSIQSPVNKRFNEAVRASKRFSILNDELVANLWATPSGREELAREYELQSFATLAMSARGDTVVMTMRLLSKDLEVWLQESDVVTRTWLKDSNQQVVFDKLTDLTQRLINRLPIDGHVTSVTGEFVTLSFGKEQSVAVGEEFDVISASVETLHPANGAWLTYKTQRTGKIQIVEIQGKSSIAKILSLTSESSIVPGNGVLIEAISGRDRFAKASKNEQEKTSNAVSNSAVVGAVTPQGAQIPPKNLVRNQPSLPDASGQATSKVENESNSSTIASTETQKSVQPESSAKSSDADLLSLLAPPGSELAGYAGLKSWSIGGTGEAKGTLPVWLINTIGGQVRRDISDVIKLEYGGEAGYGATSGGSYFAYGGRVAGLYMINFGLFDPEDRLFGGLEAHIQSKSIGSESSGGFDVTSLNLRSGAFGVSPTSIFGDKLDWRIEGKLSLQESGKFGVAGKFASIKSARSMGLKLSGYLGDKPIQGHQFGAAIEMTSGNYGLASTVVRARSVARSATYNSMGIYMLMRWIM
jgi:hypothetical protein